MHLAIAVCATGLAWLRGDWKHLGKYHKTILYVAAVALLYEYITKDYMLWDFRSNMLPHVTYIDLLYIVISQPCAVLVYLSNYPKKPTTQVWHILKWILIFVTVEWVLQHFGRIVYAHGWNLWWSVAFDCIMFPMIRLHFAKPQWAYPLSVVIIAFFLWNFHVPMK